MGRVARRGGVGLEVPELWAPDVCAGGWGHEPQPTVMYILAQAPGQCNCQGIWVIDCYQEWSIIITIAAMYSQDVASPPLITHQLVK